MNKEFIPYTEALALKELGFDEGCFGYYEPNKNLNYIEKHILKDFPYLAKNSEWQDLCAAPTFSQAFRWFRKEYKLFSSEVYDRGLDNGKIPVVHSYSFRILNLNNFKDFYGNIFNTYEESEYECLNKLIENK